MLCRSSSSTATDDYNELPKTAQRILQDMGHYLPTKTIKDTGKLVAENISEHYGNDAEIEPFECRPSILRLFVFTNSKINAILTC